MMADRRIYSEIASHYTANFVMGLPNKQHMCKMYALVLRFFTGAVPFTSFISRRLIREATKEVKRCVVSDVRQDVPIYLSKTNKMQRYTMTFITINALHVSGGSSANHQELKTVYTASGICRAFSASYRYRE
jgi:hypothetical protein